MKNCFAIAFSLAAITLPITAATAATTVNVSTGQGTESTDPTWEIGNDVAYIPTAINTAWTSGGDPAGQNGNIDGARWITPTSDGTATIPEGTVTYSTVFTLGSVGTMANLVANFWSDNRVVAILVNGVNIFTNPSAASQFNGSGTPLNTYFNVNGGANTLAFEVQNYSGGSGNPAGLRMAGIISAVPEPGTWMLMILGLGAVGFSMRRRQKAQVRFQFA